jgi:DNA-binding transcriptional ArsR family regulator
MDDAPRTTATLTSLSQIGALSSPVRMRILRHAGRPVSVAELADRLGVPTTRLYYHVNLLLQEGMLVQVDERQSGARIEKIYLRTASDFQLGPGLVDTVGDPRKIARVAAAVLFDPARADVEDHLERALADKEEAAQFGRTVVRLSAEAADRLAARMAELLNDVRDSDLKSDEQGRTYSYTVAFVPIDD